MTPTGGSPVTESNALIERARGRARAAADDDLVSVVIPARDEEQCIGATLHSLRRQEHPHLQILVVDGASTDATAAVVRRHMAEDRRIELLSNPQRTIPAALNVGLAHARGAWLV